MTGTERHQAHVHYPDGSYAFAQVFPQPAAKGDELWVEESRGTRSYRADRISTEFRFMDGKPVDLEIWVTSHDESPRPPD
jgi:hypothetical protein